MRGSCGLACVLAAALGACSSAPGGADSDRFRLGDFTITHAAILELDAGIRVVYLMNVSDTCAALAGPHSGPQTPNGEDLLLISYVDVPRDSTVTQPKLDALIFGGQFIYDPTLAFATTGSPDDFIRTSTTTPDAENIELHLTFALSVGLTELRVLDQPTLLVGTFAAVTCPPST